MGSLTLEKGILVASLMSGQTYEWLCGTTDIRRALLLHVQGRLEALVRRVDIVLILSFPINSDSCGQVI